VAFANFLSANWEKYKYVAFTDARDVAFQVSEGVQHAGARFLAVIRR